MNKYPSPYINIFGMPLTEISRQSGISYLTVYKVLVRRLKAKPFTWRKLDKVLGNNPAYLEVKNSHVDNSTCI